MRISDDRYSRDRSRFDIAMQFIRHEAGRIPSAPGPGLSDDRIRKLYRSYLCESHAAPLMRHRGKSPQQAGFFMRTGRARQESALAGEPVPAARRAAAVRRRRKWCARFPPGTRGELLCQAYRVYRGLIPEALISFEHAVFLLTALVRGDELVLERLPRLLRRTDHRPLVAARAALRAVRGGSVPIRIRRLTCRLAGRSARLAP